MEAFRTGLPTPNYPFTIDIESSVLSIGSCFAEHIGNRLKDKKCQILLNPFGILYNPLSMVRCLTSGLSPNHDFSEVLVQHDGHWHSFDHHGSFSTRGKQDLVHKLKMVHSRLYEFLRYTQVLICTFGTANIYHYKETGLPVANCHKIPAAAFEKKLVLAPEFVTHFTTLFERLRKINPSMQILLSVSPVRHLKDGAVQNQFSKAQLISACHLLCQEYAYCHYFPAYEWLMDDLRDYRFYGQDMVHPNSLAIDYIWKHFKKSLVSEKFLRFMVELEKIQISLAHRPLFPHSMGYQKFLNELKLKINQLATVYSDISFQTENDQWRALKQST